MLIPYKNFNLNVEVIGRKPDKEQIPVIFLHGFTGSAREWDYCASSVPENYYSIVPDIIGHGESDSPDDENLYTMEALISQLKTITEHLNLKHYYIVGYSMGGRLAISYTIRYKAEVTGLFLESSTPGIIDLSERKRRITHDEKIAKLISSKSAEEFFRYWYSQPLFENFLKKIASLQTFIRFKKYNITGLSNILRNFSTGKMNSWWDKLHLLNSIPAGIIVGEHDSKFRNISEIMKIYLPKAELNIVKDAGHNIHIEKPDYFSTLLNKFLQNNC